MTLSEATEAVATLISRYPNGGQGAGRGYIGGLAAVLLEYPRSIAMRCHDPLRGVPREVKFLPTPSDLIAWCERETKDLRRPIDIEDYDGTLRTEWSKRVEDEKFWKADRAARPSYDDLKARHGENWGLKAVDPVRPEAAENKRKTLIAANHRGHADMCAHYGVDPNSAASPALLIALGKLDPKKAAE